MPLLNNASKLWVGSTAVSKVFLGAIEVWSGSSGPPSGWVVGWGSNSDGQTTTPAGLTDVIGVSAGGYHSLALKSDSTVVGWGYNAYGQTTPPAGLSDATELASLHYHSLALKSDGTVVGWGLNADGQTTIPAGLTDVIGVSAGGYHSLAVTTVEP